MLLLQNLIQLLGDSKNEKLRIGTPKSQTLDLQQHYGQFFQPKLDSQPSTFDDRGGHHISSAFHPLHNASKYNSRPFRSDSSRTSYESPNFLKLSSVSDNRGSFSNLRGANPGDNSFQSTLSYHLATKFSKRHLNQR